MLRRRAGAPYAAPQRTTSARCCADRRRRQHGVEQPGEASVEVVAAQRDVPARALRPRVRQPGLAQHAQVVRAGRLGDAEVERAADRLAVGRERRTISTRTGSASAPMTFGRLISVGAGSVNGFIVRSSSYHRQIRASVRISSIVVETTKDSHPMPSLPPLPHRRARLGRDVPDRAARARRASTPSTSRRSATCSRRSIFLACSRAVEGRARAPHRTAARSSCGLLGTVGFAGFNLLTYVALGAHPAAGRRADRRDRRRCSPCSWLWATRRRRARAARSSRSPRSPSPASRS